MNFYMVARPGFGCWRHRPRAEVAYHESGHVLVAHATRRRVASATVEPRGEVAGQVAVAGAVAAIAAPASPPNDGVLALGHIVQVAFRLGGPEAERLAMGTESGGDRDRAQADALLGEAARLIALPDAWWRDYVSASVATCLRMNWPGVECVTAALLDRGTLAGEDVHTLLRDGIVPLDLSEVAASIAVLAGVKVA